MSLPIFEWGDDPAGWADNLRQHISDWHAIHHLDPTPRSSVPDTIAPWQTLWSDLDEIRGRLGVEDPVLKARMAEFQRWLER